MGRRLQVLEINDLEMVDPRLDIWNQVASWLRTLESVRNQ